MSTTKKIAAPSFALSDIYGTPRVLLVAGGVLCLVGALLVSGGGLGFKRTAQSLAFLELAQDPLRTSVTFSEAHGLLGDAPLPAVSQGAARASSALQGAPVPLLWGDAKDAYRSFIGYWGGFDAALSPLAKSAPDVEALRAALLDSAAGLQGLDRLLANVRANAPGSLSAYADSLARLQAYSESAVGAHAAARIEYDVQMLAYSARQAMASSGTAELRVLLSESVALAGRVQPLAAAAKRSAPTREQLLRVATSAEPAAAALVPALVLLDAAATTATKAVAAGIIALLAGALALLGGLLLAMRDFESRFRRAAGQFRKNEHALGGLQGAMQSLLRGDFSVVLPSSDDPQLAELSSLLNSFVLMVRDTLASVSAAATSTEDLSAIAVQGALDTALATARQAAGLQETEQQLRVVTMLMEASFLDTHASVHAVKLAMSSVQDGARAVLDSIESMDGIRDNIHETSKRVKRLGERSQAVGEVVDILATFSEQINILAMNASLEAERAGEQGRGFAVVAAEVRRLSSRAEDTLASISSLVQGMQADTREAIEAMERTTHKVVIGAHVTELAGASVDGIRTGVDTLAGMVNALSGAAAEQALQVESVGTGIAAAADISRRISGGLERAQSDLREVLRTAQNTRAATETTGA